MSTILPESELRALISLLDDDDDFTRMAAETKVAELGARAEPFLREAALNGSDPLREAASGILRSIAFRHDDWQAITHGFLHRQSAGSRQDEEVCFREIRFEFRPMLCPDKLRGRIDFLRQGLQTRTLRPVANDH